MVPGWLLDLGRFPRCQMGFHRELDPYPYDTPGKDRSNTSEFTRNGCYEHWLKPVIGIG